MNRNMCDGGPCRRGLRILMKNSLAILVGGIARAWSFRDCLCVGWIKDFALHCAGFVVRAIARDRKIAVCIDCRSDTGV